MRDAELDSASFDKGGLTLGQRVTDAIILMIADGRFEPGQRLIEASIARDLGVGTVPVREALRTLAGDGVVEIRANRGATLRSPPLKELVDTLKAVSGLLMVALDAIEPDSLDEVVPRLEAIIVRMAAASAARDKRAMFQCSAEFQNELLLAGKNEYILKIVDRVHFEFYISALLPYVPVSLLDQLMDPYRAIAKALTARDLAAARVLFQQNARLLESGLMHG